MEALIWPLLALVGAGLGSLGASLPPAPISLLAFPTGMICGWLAGMWLVFRWDPSYTNMAFVAVTVVAAVVAALTARALMMATAPTLGVLVAIIVLVWVRGIPERRASRDSETDARARRQAGAWRTGSAELRVLGATTQVVTFNRLGTASGFQPEIGATANWRNDEGWELTLAGFTSRWSGGQSTRQPSRFVLVRDPKGRTLRDDAGACRVTTSRISAVAFVGTGVCARVRWMVDDAGPEDLEFEFSAE